MTFPMQFHLTATNAGHGVDVRSTNEAVKPAAAGGDDVMQQEWTLTYESIQRIV